MAEKKYVIDNAELMAEWDWEKNTEFNPNQLTHGSHKKVWWFCQKCHHSWMDTIAHRYEGRTCPSCNKKNFASKYRKTVISRTDSLAEKHPEIASQWHPTKNGKEAPYHFTPTSGKKVWWQCEKGHEWQAVIDARVRYKTGCPICSGRVALKGVNDLVTTHPQIAAEWHPTKNGELKPENFKIGSDKIVWWKCHKGHEWRTNIYHRQETGCPECLKERFTSFPEQAIFYYLKRVFNNVYNRYMLDERIELDIYIPEYRIAIEYDGAKFHNTIDGLKRDKLKYDYLRRHDIYLIRIKESKKESFLKDVADICLGYEDNKNNRNLPIILNDLQILLSKRLNMVINLDIDLSRDRQQIYMQYLDIEKQNSIAVQFPYLINEWIYEKNEPVTPYMVTKGSEKVFWWRCSNGHEYQAPVKYRTKTGCPYCSNNKLLSGFNDLATTHPHLANQWIVEKNSGILPSEIIGGKQIVWWRCNKGHEWEASIDSRKRGSGCPICANKKVLAGYNDLKTMNPKLAKEWHPTKNKELLPINVTASSGRKVWWKCNTCGHEWEALISTRNRGSGCPNCAKKL